MSALLPFLAFTFIAAFTPGPNNCMALSHATRGLRSGLMFSLGVFVGMLIVMPASALLSGFMAQHLRSAQTIMQAAGCAYMLWLAFCLWNAGPAVDHAMQADGKLLFSGCVLQLVNPKLIAYGITAFSVFILPQYQDITTLMAFAAVLALIGFAGTVTWAVSGVALKKLFHRHPIFINRTLAVMVLGCAFSSLA